MKQNKISICSVTGWSVGAVPKVGMAVIQFDHLTSPLQTPNQAQPSPHYALLPEQLRALIGKMQEALTTLESQSSPS